MTLVLYDASGKELQINRDTNRRDPLLDFTVPADGVYYVEIHDFLYAGSNEFSTGYRSARGRISTMCFLPPAPQARTISTRCTAETCRRTANQTDLGRWQAAGKPGHPDCTAGRPKPAESRYRLGGRARQIGDRRHRVSACDAAGAHEFRAIGFRHRAGRRRARAER